MLSKTNKYISGSERGVRKAQKEVVAVALDLIDKVLITIHAERHAQIFARNATAKQSIRIRNREHQGPSTAPMFGATSPNVALNKKALMLSPQPVLLRE